MPADLVIVQGDTQPILSDQLEYVNAEKVNLEGATVTFIMRSPTAERPLVLTGTVTVTAPEEGKITYTPTAADTAVPGNYMAAWHVRFASGKEMTFPTEGYMWVQVQPNLTATGVGKLVGLPAVKQYLRIQETNHTHDDELVDMIDAAQPLIENLTGPITGRTYSEWHEGGHVMLNLRHKPSFGYGTSPVLTVLACSEYRGPIEYALAAVPTPTQGSVYSEMSHPELGVIVRRTAGGGTYPFWRDPNHPAQSVHVVYYAGQETVPANVKRAMLETIRWWWDTTQAVGRGSLTQADAEPIRPSVALPYHCEAMLAPTRRPPAFA